MVPPSAIADVQQFGRSTPFFIPDSIVSPNRRGLEGGITANTAKCRAAALHARVQEALGAEPPLVV